jgi:hypothetical protein
MTRRISPGSLAAYWRADYYVPDTDANFQQYFVPNQASGAAGMAVVITFVNDTGGPASLPVGLFVSFTDQSGNSVGNRQRFNSPYGCAVTNGQGSGEAFSSLLARGSAQARRLRNRQT